MENYVIINITYSNWQFVAQGAAGQYEQNFLVQAIKSRGTDMLIFSLFLTFKKN